MTTDSDLTPESINALADKLDRYATAPVNVGYSSAVSDYKEAADALRALALLAAENAALKADLEHCQQDWKAIRVAKVEAENQTLRGIIDRYRLVFKMLYEVHALVNFDTPEDSELQAKVLAEALDCLTPAEAEFFASRGAVRNQEPT